MPGLRSSVAELTFGNILFLPRGHEISGTAPEDKPGLKWKTKCAAVGPTREKYLTLVDGVNEEGLAVGTRYHPGYAEYPEVRQDEFSKTIAPTEFATWLLTNFATVEEARKAIPNVVVGRVVFPAWGLIQPFHYIVHDADGNCMVIEFIKGKMVVYDNPLGVMTNSPTFDWHITNLLPKDWIISETQSIFAQSQIFLFLLTLMQRLINLSLP